MFLPILYHFGGWVEVPRFALRGHRAVVVANQRERLIGMITQSGASSLPRSGIDGANQHLPRLAESMAKGNRHSGANNVTDQAKLDQRSRQVAVIKGQQTQLAAMSREGIK
jgi:hypothetical protein